MKVLLTNTYYQKRVEHASLISVVPPLDIAYCASLVRSRVSSAEVSLLDANALKLGYEQHVSKIKDIGPGILVFTAATHSINSIKHLIPRLKMPICKTILIGSHGTAFPKEVLSEIKELDIVVCGEPEFSVLEIVESLMEQKPLSLVNGICYRDVDKIVCNQPRHLIADLDSLPFPARDLLPNRLYFSPYEYPVTSIQTTRGCPGKCSFCDSHLLSGSLLRMRSPDMVVNEIEESYNKFKIKYFAIIDHTFTANRIFVANVCKEIINRKLNSHIKWACNTRVDMLDDDILLLMKHAGCLQIGVGIESGYNKGLESVKKGITENQIKEAIARIKRHGIFVVGYAIIGFPGDTKESVDSTKQKIFDYNPHGLQLSFAAPLPGSQLYDYCKKSDLIMTDNWDDFVFLRKSIIRNNSLSSEIISKIRDHIIRSFYFRPGKIVELLFFIIFRSGINRKSAIKGACKILFNFGR